MRGPRKEKIESMFDSIAPEYDQLNHLMSLDIDKTWRRRSLRQITDKHIKQEILDVACGTGDFSIEIAKGSHPETVITGLDLSEGMLKVMSSKVEKAGLSGRIRAEKGDCEKMRFEDCSFDRVTIAFGIRNFEHRETALQEILRVLKPGGKLVILELSVPGNRFIRWLYKLYFCKLMPVIGGKISGDRAAYNYLPASVLAFPDKKEWMLTMQNCGFTEVGHKAFSLGICRMFCGTRPFGTN